MLTATALVLLMTPALGLFYAGLVRSKNTLNTFMMSIAALGAVTITWAFVAYSLAFSGQRRSSAASTTRSCATSASTPTRGLTIPDLLFFAYQATFCIITAALISGAVVERMRFVPFMVFMVALGVPRLRADGALGLGRRLARRSTARSTGPAACRSRWRRASRRSRRRSSSARARTTAARPCCRTTASTCSIGAGLLWFGWFGFNGGSGLNAGSGAALSFTNTLLAPAATLVVWIVLDYVRGGKATAIGAATAIIVGCVLITPAAGYISPMSAILLGALGAIPSYFFIV